METEEKIIEGTEPAAAEAPSAAATTATGDPRRAARRAARRTPARARPERRSEFDQRMIKLRRVARVVAGGRRFSFSAAIILGNRKGKVGVGLGKAGDTALAIEKATRNAKKNMITVRLTQDGSVAHDVSAKFCASRISIMPVKNRGLVAGSSVRGVLELAGITNVLAKVHSGSKNGLNNARAAIEALKELKA